MTRQAPTIVRFSLSESGRLSVLIEYSKSSQPSSSFKVQLREHGSKSNAQLMEFVRVVHGMGHYQATLKPRSRFSIVCVSSSGRRTRLPIPNSAGALQYPVLPSLLGHVQRTLGIGSRYFFFNPGKRLDASKIVTNHDSVHIWLPEAQMLTLRARKSETTISSRASVDGKSNIFSYTEFSEALRSLRDGESLWDFYLRRDSDRRLSFWGPNSVNPRKTYKYPWFWVGDERFSAKARIYWTVDGNLALKVIKKGLR